MNLHWGRAQSYIILFLLYFLDRDLVLLFVLLKVENITHSLYIERNGSKIIVANIGTTNITVTVTVSASMVSKLDVHSLNHSSISLYTINPRP